MWEGFAGAIVRIGFATGAVVLTPEVDGEVGTFPFDSPVHIITAYNPAGIEINGAANELTHQTLGVAVNGYDTFPTVGSARDGSMAEPGYAVLGLELDEAIELGRRFGQVAIYRWTADALTIVGVDEPTELRLGWTLSED